MSFVRTRKETSHIQQQQQRKNDKSRKGFNLELHIVERSFHFNDLLWNERKRNQNLLTQYSKNPTVENKPLPWENGKVKKGLKLKQER